MVYRISNTSLKGRRIVVTRAWHQAADFVQKLEGAGAIALHYPCVDILPPQNVDALDRCMDDLFAGRFDWLVLTSQNSVLALASRVKIRNQSQPWPRYLKMAAVGPATAAAAKDFLGVDIHAMPQVFDADSLGHLLHDCANQSILLPHADIARPELAHRLRQNHAQVTEVVAYRTTKGSGGVSMAESLSKNGIDAITFASPSAVHYFLERIHDEGLAPSAIAEVCIACIGHVTEQAARKSGLTVSVSPKQHTVDAMILALREYFA